MFIDEPENPPLTCRHETVPFEGVMEAQWVALDQLEIWQNKETFIAGKSSDEPCPIHTVVKRRLKAAYLEFPDLFKGLL